MAWREEYGIDTILRTPKPYFELIKKYYPTRCTRLGKVETRVRFRLKRRDSLARFWRRCGRSRTDSSVSTTIRFTSRRRARVSFVMTFPLQRFDDRPWPLGKTIRIVDMSRLGTDDVAFNVFGFLRVMSDVSKRAFVERIHKIYVLNPPPSFAVIFNTFKPMISAKTQKQIVVCRTLEDFKRGKVGDRFQRRSARVRRFLPFCGDCWPRLQRERKLRALVRRLNGSSNGSSNEAN